MKRLILAATVIALGLPAFFGLISALNALKAATAF